jgi:hypothetical protein
MHLIVLETYDFKIFVSPLHYLDTFMKDIICSDLYMIYIIAVNMSVIPKISHYFGYRCLILNHVYDMKKIMYTYWSLILCPCYIVLEDLMF